MNLQSNLKGVRDELQKDEKLLENAFRLEILWRRYRKYVFGLIVIAVGFGLWWAISDYMQQNRAKEASSAYDKLIVDSHNQAALDTLKNASPKLYDVYRYFNASGDKTLYEELSHSQLDFLRDVARYELASINASQTIQNLKDNDDKAHFKAQISQDLQSLERTKEGALKDLAILQEAYMLIVAGDTEQAHQKLLLISPNSPFAQEANNLKHYGVQ